VTAPAHIPRAAALVLTLTLVGCGDDAGATDAGATDAGATDAGTIDAGTIDAQYDAPPWDPSMYVDGAVIDYDWTCTGEVPSVPTAPDAPPPSGDCSAGVWPDLDSTIDVCPTFSPVRLTDPTSGLELPLSDARTLPVEIPLSESGTFLPPSGPASWPSTIKIVAWNVEYTARFDEQLDVLATHPDLSDADVYLLGEVDRCSTRNGVRRAARVLAERLSAVYVYGIEFVELDIGRDVGGDTGQAIVSRRPLVNATLTCHSMHEDWFASESQPRLGQRVFLHGDVPMGETFARVFAIHFESSDLWGMARAVQVRELLDAAQAYACERPMVVGGDTNAWYATGPEHQLLENAGFVDAVGMFDEGFTTSTSPARRLDYVYTRNLEVVAGGVVRDVTLSDHFAVWVELALL
jgi:endonuclease/exonuclease/phosphatase family metal-dependent hydrolase